MKFIKPVSVILDRFFKDPQQNLKLLIHRQLDKETNPPLDDSEKHAVTRTVYGVVRHESQLNFAIGSVSSRKLKKIHPPVLLLLKIGAYLLLYSGSYPDYAVVNETVSCAGGKTRGFVNAMLRNILRQKETLLSTLENHKNPSVRFNIPPILIQNLETISGDGQLETHLQYLDSEPLFHLRTHPQLLPFSKAADLLKEKGIQFTPLEAFQSFQVKDAGGVINRLMEQYPFYFQNTASQLISIIASEFAKERVLDGCAAPGTKSLTLALQNPSLPVYANDLHPGRAKLIRQTAGKFQQPHLHTVVSDIKQLSFKDRFDFVLVDAPCTSSGTLRKNPDLKLKIDAPRIEQNAEIQRQIMETLTREIKTQDVYILYSVCSFIKEETEDCMAHIVDAPVKSKQWQTIDLTTILEKYRFSFYRGKYGFYLLPDNDLNNDLFYLSLLRH